MVTSVTPPPLQGPTAKEKKYDRQLRLWAAAGQQALEEAHVLLLNSGAGVVGIETLKNLVLPGIGNFTIVDERDVEEADLGVNFFLEESSLGKSRAEECCRLLQELNPEVKGYAVQQSIETFVSNTEFLTKYTLILLVSPTSLSTILRPVSDYTWTHSIPLFYTHSNGFYSSFSLQLPAQFPIIDTHPEPASTQDLRLLNPWHELIALTKTKTDNLDTLSDHDHGHIPYLLLLLHYLEKWKASHNGLPPTTYSEKSAFRDLVRASTRTTNPEGGEENFDEAVAAVLKSLNPPSISSGLRSIFESEECQTPTAASANFYILAHALCAFHTTHAVLPLPGALPDMKSQSADYITLQTTYRTRARADLAVVTATVRALETSLHRDVPVPAAEIEAFCKNAQFVKLVKGRKLLLPTPDAESVVWDGREGYVLGELEMGGEDGLMGLVLCMLALDSYLDEHDGILPGLGEAEEAKQNAFKWAMSKYTERVVEGLKRQVGGERDTEEAMKGINHFIQELARGGAGELHNVGALMGGVVAQEAIKVVTRQYVPVDNACVFDGVGSRTGVFRL